MRLVCIAMLVSLFSMTAWAQDDDQVAQNAPTPPVTDPNAAGQQTGAHPAAITYSPGYETRLKIHKYASFATLPLFVTELKLGQTLYNDSLTNPTGANKGAHIAVGTGIIGLFGLNTVTGAWNLWEARDDPNGRKMRWIHGVLMMASNAGFVATAMTGPHSGRSQTVPLTFASSRTTHRDLAIASISVGTVGYVIMLFRKH